MNTEPIYVTFEFNGNLGEEVNRVKLGIQGLRDESASTYKRLLADSNEAFNAMSANNRKLAVSIQEDINSLRQLAAAQKATDDAFKRGSMSVTEYTEAKARLAVQEADLRQGIEDGITKLDESIQKDRQAVDAINTKQEALAKLEDSYRKLSGAERNGEEGQQMLEQIRNLKSELGGLDKAYQEATGNGQSLLQTFQSAPGPIGQTTTAIGKMTKAALTFIATPLGMILAAIAAALAAVTSWFRRTEEGENALAVASAAFGQVLDSLLDVVDKVGEWLYKAFTNPKEALSDLSEFIKGQFMNRLNAISKMGNAIVKIFSEDWKQGFQEFSDAFLQFETGIEDVSKKSSAWMEETIRKMKERTKIEKELIKIKDEERALEVQIAKDEIKKLQLREKASDLLLPEKERLEALKEMNKIINSTTEKQVKLSERKMELTKKMHTLSNSNRAANDEDARLEVEYLNKKSAGLREQISLIRLRNGITGRMNTEGNEINAIKAETAMRALEIKRQQDDLKRLEVEAELDIRQARINAMEEGSRKELEQINLNYDKAYATNVRRASEMVKARQELERKVWENENPSWKKKGLEFSPSTKGVDDLPVNEQARLLSYDMAAKDTRRNELVKYQKDLLEKYQDYTDRRLAIEKRYNDDIEALQAERRKAEEAGEKEKANQLTRSIAKATKDKGKEMMSVDLDQLKESPEYVRAFENLKRTSSETLQSLLSQFESAKEEAARVLSPDQLREYTTTIQNIMDELDQRNPFQSLIDKKEELAAAEQEMAEAQAALDKARTDAEAVKNGAQIQSGGRITGVDKKNGTISSEKVYLSEEEALKKVKDATDNYNKAKDKVNDKNAKVKASEKEVEEQVSALAESIAEVGNAIGGPAGEIITLIGDIGTFAMTAMSGVKMAAATTSESISTIEKASVILMVISAAIQLAMKIASFFGPKDQEQYEKMKGNYENLVKIWDKLIDRKKEYISINTGDDAVKAGQEALEILRKQEEATKKLALARLKVKNGGHSIEYRQWKGSYKFDGQNWKDIAGEIEQHTGKAFRSMRDLVEMSADDLEWIMGDYSGFWANLDTDFREYLEQLMEYKKQAEDINNTVNEAVTQTSFDTMREDFLDALLDMDSSAEDFADNMEKYMQKAILNGMVVDKFDDQLKDWYKDWVAKSEGGMTESEYNELKDSYNNIVQGAINDRNQLKDLFGWQSEDSRTAASKGVASMSQDSADQLNGNFYALLIYQDKTSTAVTNINTLLVQGLDTLTRIAANTDRLENIEKDMKAMRGHMQDMLNKGLIMRKQ